MSSRAIWRSSPGFRATSASNDELRSSRSLSRTARTVADRGRSLSSAISPAIAPPEVVQDPLGPARRHRDPQPAADQDEQPVAS